MTAPDGREGTRNLLAFAIPLLLVSLVMRAPFLAVPPVLPGLAADLGLGETAAGALMSLPVLCFGAFGAAAMWIAPRIGVDATISITLVLLCCGIAARSLGGIALLFAGMTVIGAAIAIMNVTVPVAIREHAPGHITPLMGGYTAAMNLSAAIATLAAAPLAASLAWRGSLLLTAVPVIVAGLAWWLATRGNQRPARGHQPAPRAEAQTAPPPRPEQRQDPAHHAEARHGRSSAMPEVTAPEARSRTPLVVLLCAWFACQASSFYGLAAWLPAMLSAEGGASAELAGSVASLFQLLGIAGALLMPPLTRGRAGGTVLPVLIASALWMTVPAGLLAAPGLAILWIAIGGIAQGAGFTLIMASSVLISRDTREATRISAIVQSTGYLACACAPPVMGFLHEQSGSWDIALALPLATTTGYLALGLATQRARRGHERS